MYPLEHGASNVGLTNALVQLRSQMKFDAALVLRQPRGPRSHVVSCVGYGASAAWALQNVFPRDYEVGFTARLNPADRLPLSISDAGGDVSDRFTNSVLFRDYLGADGYRDGMSLELFDSGEYLGVMHFSSREPRVFTTDRRALAQGMSGLFALALRAEPDVLGSPELSSVHLRWNPNDGYAQNSGALSFLGDPAFRAILESFVNSPADRLRHLWHHRGTWSRVSLARRSGFADVEISASVVPAADLWNLTLQEVRVLSGLVIGRSDAEIATALDLSVRTVHAHMSSIRSKMGASRRTEAAAMATASGICIPGAATAPVEQLARIYRGGASL
ncbi:LuxR C-terminal-related transcriptional regulator [Gordonia sp. NPDC003424]